LINPKFEDLLNFKAFKEECGIIDAIISLKTLAQKFNLGQLYEVTSNWKKT
jgi:hypothetical protein